MTMSWFSTAFVWTPDRFDSVFTEPPRPLFRTHGVFWVSCSPHTNHKESMLPPQVKYLDNSLHPCCSHFGLCDWPNGGFSESAAGSLRLWSESGLLAPRGLVNPLANWKGTTARKLSGISAWTEARTHVFFSISFSSPCSARNQEDWAFP